MVEKIRFRFSFSAREKFCVQKSKKTFINKFYDRISFDDKTHLLIHDKQF